MCDVTVKRNSLRSNVLPQTGTRGILNKTRFRSSVKRMITNFSSSKFVLWISLVVQERKIRLSQKHMLLFFDYTCKKKTSLHFHLFTFSNPLVIYLILKETRRLIQKNTILISYSNIIQTSW